MMKHQPGIYRHFKGGYYRLIGEASHSETLEDMVVYQALYGEGAWWVRPSRMWEEEVSHEGRIVQRFTPVPELSLADFPAYDHQD